MELAQLLESNAGSLRVEGDIYRKWNIANKKDNQTWNDIGESFNNSIAPLENLVDNLLYGTYSFPIEVVSTNVERNPAPVKKDGKTTYPIIGYKHHSKETISWTKDR